MLRLQLLRRSNLDGAPAVSRVVSIEDFEAFVRARSTPLLRTAFLLVGDRGHAEDLLQDVLTKTARQWHRIDGPPEPYVRRALLNAAVNGWKRRRVTEVTWNGQDVAGPDAYAGLDLRAALLQCLRELPPRQRAGWCAATSTTSPRTTPPRCSGSAPGR